MSKYKITSIIKDGSDNAKEIGLGILKSQRFKEDSPIGQKLLAGEVLKVLNESDFSCDYHKNRDGTFPSEKRARETIEYFDMWYIYYLGIFGKDLKTLRQMYKIEKK